MLAAARGEVDNKEPELKNKNLFAKPPSPRLHPLAYLGQARMKCERDRLMKLRKIQQVRTTEDFERKMACNKRKVEALERSLAAQQRTAEVIAMRQAKEAADAAKDKSMAGLLAAKLAGPKATHNPTGTVSLLLHPNPTPRHLKGHPRQRSRLISPFSGGVCLLCRPS